MAYIPNPIEEAVMSFVSGMLPDNTIIYANQGGPRPKQEYCTLFMIDDRNIQVKDTYHYLDVTSDSPEFKLVMEAERESRFSLQCFGPNSYNTLYDFTFAANTPSNIITQNNLGFTIRQFLQLERIPMPMSESIEMRTVLNIRIAYRLSKFYSYSALQSAIANPEF